MYQVGRHVEHSGYMRNSTIRYIKLVDMLNTVAICETPLSDVSSW